MSETKKRGAGVKLQNLKRKLEVAQELSKSALTTKGKEIGKKLAVDLQKEIDKLTNR